MGQDVFIGWKRDRHDHGFGIRIRVPQLSCGIDGHSLAKGRTMESTIQDCPECGKPGHHEVPGATRLFVDFIDRYAPGTASKKRRQEMYGLRSGVLHGADLLQIDQDIAVQ